MMLQHSSRRMLVTVKETSKMIRLLIPVNIVLVFSRHPCEAPEQIFLGTHNFFDFN